MSWSPNSAAPAPAQPAAGHAPPPGYPAQQPGTFQPGQPAPGYGAPQTGYGPPAGGFGGGFRPVAPNLNQREPQLPFGDHIAVATGRVELVGQKRDLLIVEFEIEQSNNAEPGVKGCWKRQLTGTHRANDQMVSDAIGRLVVPLSGRQLLETDPQQALAMISEFFNAHTIDGKPIAGMRVGMSVTPNKKGKTDAAGLPYAEYVFHTL